MAEVLVTDFNPMHPEEPLPPDLEVYSDDEKDAYIIREKTTGDLVIEVPKTFPPNNV